MTGTDLANDDCHLKNLSFLVGPDGISLAPHYGLLATGVYHTRALAGNDGHWPDVELAVRLSPEVHTFQAVTPEAVMAAGAILGVPKPVALRAVRDVCNRVFRAFDRLYAQHYPAEPGLVSKSTLPTAHSGLEAIDESPDEDAQDKAPTLGVRNGAQLALERRILRILRYTIFPEMLARLPS